MENYRQQLTISQPKEVNQKRSANIKKLFLVEYCNSFLLQALQYLLFKLPAGHPSSR